MRKKLLSSFLLIFSLMFFTACDKKDSSSKMKSRKPTMRGIQQEGACPKKDPCPPKEEKPCCASEKAESSVSKEQVSSSEKAKPERYMPLEELKNSLDTQSEEFNFSDDQNELLDD